MATPLGLFDPALRILAWLDVTAVHPEGWMDPTLIPAAASGGTAYVETGTVSAEATVTGADSAGRIETATVAAAATVTGSDIATWVETGTVDGNIPYADVAHDEAAFADTGIAAGATVITGADAVALLESADVTAAAASTGLDLAILVETGAADPVADITAEDIYTAGGTAQNYVETGWVAAQVSITAVDTSTYSELIPLYLRFGSGKPAPLFVWHDGAWH